MTEEVNFTTQLVEKRDMNPLKTLKQTITSHQPNMTLAKTRWEIKIYEDLYKEMTAEQFIKVFDNLIKQHPNPTK
ncbi:MAG: hypothetical protein ABI045_05455 [Flavobacteriales bacterium]